MFCSEKILAVYKGCREYDDIHGSNSFFDCYHDLAYHVTEGERIVLETEHYYTSIGATGVVLNDKISDIAGYAQAGELLEPYVHWTDYESTLFVGERLCEVIKDEFGHTLKFDDFTLKVIPHDLAEDDVSSLSRKNRWAYNHVLGANRHLKRSCACGGEGELLIDFVSDYVVRCNMCKKSTCAQMVAQDAIEEWNAGNNHCDLSDITIE